MMKLKAFADDKINEAQMMISVLDRVENWGKRRKCWLSAFSPFSTMFSKGFLLRVVKSRDCVVKSFKSVQIFEHQNPPSFFFSF